MMQTIKVRRSVVAEIFDRVRQDLAARVAPEEIERRLATGHYRGSFHGPTPALPPLVACEHGAYTDACYTCAPRWGWTGPKVVCK